jgi:hypothetical protein
VGKSHTFQIFKVPGRRKKLIKRGVLKIKATINLLQRFPLKTQPIQVVWGGSQKHLTTEMWAGSKISTNYAHPELGEKNNKIEKIQKKRRE